MTDMDKAPPQLGPGDPHCVRCELHSTCKRVCIGGHIHTSCANRTAQAVRAIYILGQSPGRMEDHTGLNFQGESGARLDQGYIGLFKLDQFGDIYVANAVRCFPPDHKVSDKHLKACQRYLFDDLRRLQDRL